MGVFTLSDVWVSDAKLQINKKIKKNIYRS